MQSEADYKQQNVTEFSINLSLRMFNLNCAPKLAESVAHLMNSEWPKNLQHRIKKIKRDLSNKNGFPLHLVITTSFIPINNENKILDNKYLYVIGHGKLTKSHNVKHGFTGIIYDVVIDKRFRGLKLGNKLLLKLEEIALQKGITYLYLSTHSAIKFYKKLGYKERVGQIISDLRKNANRLTSDEIQKLENLLIHKLKKYHSDNNNNLSSNKNVNSTKNVWLTKRICRFIKPVNNEVNYIVINKYFGNKYQNNGFCYIMPFIEQVGPNCAFAAMANVEYFVNNYNNVITNQRNNMTFIGVNNILLDHNNFSMISKTLLNECISNKMSLDGEMYDLNVLCNILKNGFNNDWNFEMVECNLINCYKYISDNNYNLKNANQDKLLSFLLIPYDKDHDCKPQIQSVQNNIGNNNDFKHIEMDEIDIDYDIDNGNKKCNMDKIVASSAHYAVICGGFMGKNSNYNHQLINTVTDLIEMIDIEHNTANNLFLCYITPSKYELYILNANVLIESNHSLKHQIIPPWTLNKQMNLGHKMIHIKVTL